MYFSDQYTALYFFSAIFQGNMALIGILGVFIVFKLQKFSQDETIVYEQLKDIVRNNFLITTNYPPQVQLNFFDAKSLINYFSELSKSESIGTTERIAKSIISLPSFISQSNLYKTIVEIRLSIITEMKFTFIFILIPTIISLLSMVYAIPLFHKFQFGLLFIISITTSIEIFSLFSAVYFIFKVIRE